MIEIRDAAEKRIVAIGTMIVVLRGEGSLGVVDCLVEPSQTLQTGYSYDLVNTDTGDSLSATCTGLPGPGQIASFQRN